MANTVGTANMLRAEWPRKFGSTADRGKKNSLIPQNVKSESGVQPFPCSLDIVAFSAQE